MSDPSASLEANVNVADPDSRSLVKVVQAAILISLLWNTFCFIQISAAHVAFPLEDPFFPWPLQRLETCLLYTSPSPRDLSTSRMPSSA